MNEFQAFDPRYSAVGVGLADAPHARTPAAIHAGQSSYYYAEAAPSAHQPHASSHQEPRAAAPRPEILAAHYVRKSYRKAALEIPVLQGVELSIGQGEFVAIIGPSGCGKSTLLHLLATLDAPDSGEIRFEGNRIDNLPAAGRDILRNRYFGM